MSSDIRRIATPITGTGWQMTSDVTHTVDCDSLAPCSCGAYAASAAPPPGETSQEDRDEEEAVYRITIVRYLPTGSFAAMYQTADGLEGGMGEYSATPIGALAELCATLIKVAEDKIQPEPAARSAPPAATPETVADIEREDVAFLEALKPAVAPPWPFTAEDFEGFADIIEGDETGGCYIGPVVAAKLVERLRSAAALRREVARLQQAFADAENVITGWQEAHAASSATWRERVAVAEREVERLTLSTGLPCRDCGQPHDEYSVTNTFWNRIMRPDGKETEYEYMCLTCFLRHVAGRLDAAESARWRG